jgi:hypothetical protein
MKLTDLIKDETRKQLAQKKISKKFSSAREKIKEGKASKKELYDTIRSDYATEVGYARAKGNELHGWVKKYLEDNPGASNRELADEAIRRQHKAGKSLQEYTG